MKTTLVVTVLAVCVVFALLAYQHKAVAQQEEEHTPVAVAALPSQPTVHPVLQQLAQLQRELGQTDLSQLLIRAGTIYAMGSYPAYLPDDDLALKCYHIASMGTGEPAAMAQALYLATKLEPVPWAERAGAKLPREAGLQICAAATEALRAAAATQQPTRLQQHNAHIYYTITPIRQTPPPVRRPAAAAAEGDRQNSHDTAVMAAMRTNLKKLGSTPSNSTPIEDIYAAISTSEDLSPQQLQVISRTLASLTNHKHTSLGSSEQAALQLAWNTIQAVEEPRVRSNMVETLGKQLASAEEAGSSVCSTGKIARIMASLDGVDTVAAATGTVPLKPITAVREELANLAGKVRSDQLAALPADRRAAYDAGQDEMVAHAMREQFSQAVQKTYVQELGMSASVLSPLVAVYNDQF